MCCISEESTELAWTKRVIELTRYVYPFVKQAWEKRRDRLAKADTEARELVDQGRDLVRKFGLHYDSVIGPVPLLHTGHAVQPDDAAAVSAFCNAFLLAPENKGKVLAMPRPQKAV